MVFLNLTPVFFAFDEDIRLTGHKRIKGVSAREDFINAPESLKTVGAFLKREDWPALPFVDEFIFRKTYYQSSP